MALRKGSKPVSITHPHLMDEWDFEKNGGVRPEDFSYGSSVKVWWLCKKCGYSWGAAIVKRTDKNTPRNCPACSGRVVTDRNRLSLLFPEVCEEWDYCKNELKPCGVSYASGKIVWWRCLKPECRHSWKAQISNRTIHKTGCPACNNKIATDKNNLAVLFPELAQEWHKTKNIYLVPSQVTRGSGKKIWWKCSVCKYVWRAAVKDRTLGGECPSCIGRVPSKENNLFVLFPEVCEEWDYSKNKISPEKITYGSGEVVWWKCKNPECSYEWEAKVSHRTRKKDSTGCPACSNKVVTDKNNLAVKFPEIAVEWHPTKNKLGPEEVVFGSGSSVWWRCGNCSGEWKTRVINRTRFGTECPFCSRSSISKVSQDWLDILGVGRINREVFIKELGFRVDGFDPETNTVYEFLGDYWHGNPKVYKRKEINLTNKKYFGQLYKETMERIDLLKRNDYKVVYIWEKDFNEGGIDGAGTFKSR